MIVSLAIHPELRKKHIPRRYLKISNARNLPRKSPGPSQTRYSRVSPCAIDVLPSAYCVVGFDRRDPPHIPLHFTDRQCTGS